MTAACSSDMMQLDLGVDVPEQPQPKKSLSLCAHLPFVEDHADFDLAHHHVKPLMPSTDESRNCLGSVETLCRAYPRRFPFIHPP